MRHKRRLQHIDPCRPLLVARKKAATGVPGGLRPSIADDGVISDLALGVRAPSAGMNVCACSGVSRENLLRFLLFYAFFENSATSEALLQLTVERVGAVIHIWYITVCTMCSSQG